MSLTIVTFKYKNTERLTVKIQKKTLHTNTNQKEAGTAILLSDKIDFEAKKSTTKDAEHHSF